MGHAHRKQSPGRCDRCGCLMVLVRLGDGESERLSAGQAGWECLVCNRTVDVETMAHRQKGGGAGLSGTPRRRGEKVIHA